MTTVTRNTAYDAWGRPASRTWKNSSTAILTTTYEYPDSGVNKVCLPSAVVNGSNRIEYTYDNNGNITSIKDGSATSTYAYDELNQLISENNVALNKTLTYRYDVGGNLVEVKEYAYTTAATITTAATATTTGTFDGTWKDKLTKWGSTAMTYDAVGNMLTKGSVSCTWTQGRKLASVSNGKSIQYQYDHTGARIKKVVDGTTTVYRMAGSLIVSEKTGSDTIWYHYDSNANVIAAYIGGVRYYYLRNAQNDVIGLIDGSGNLVVEYKYDSWGNIISITGSLASTVGQKNPFRYRGYYYDVETGLYYLQSRYYDPQIRRFISSDTAAVLAIRSMTLADKNLYTYCDNNPIVRKDVSGHVWETIFDLASLAVSAVDVAANPADLGAWANLLGDGVDLIPFVTGVGETIKGLRTASKIADGTDEAIDTYRNLRKVNKGNGKEVHHILEKRLVKQLQSDIKSLDDVLSIALTKTEHRIYTNTWRSLLPYGKSHTEEEIVKAAAKVYASSPRLMGALLVTLMRIK